MDPQPHDPMHDKLDNAFKEKKRQTKREEYTTPAMRMYLATVPVKLETILNTDWHAKLATSQRYKSRVKKQTSRNEAPVRSMSGFIQQPSA
jgi:hypothetical protein